MQSGKERRRKALRVVLKSVSLSSSVKVALCSTNLKIAMFYFTQTRASNKI